MLKYKYDAWGNSLTVVSDVSANDIAELNPFRYRGYYFDTETGLYFLKTRYYDPEIGRFITIDDISYLDPDSINGLNLYAYCGNNPVMGVDPQGNSWWSSFWSGVGDWFKENGVKLAIGAAFIVAGAVVTALTAGTGTTFMVALGGALLTSLKAVAISTAISAGIGFAMGGISSLSWQGALQGLSDGIADGFMWGGIFAGTAQMLGSASKLLANRNVDFSKKTNWLFGNRNTQSTTILRVNNSSNKQLFRLDADTSHLWHLHFGATRKIMELHRTKLVLAGYLGILNSLKFFLKGINQF